MQEVLRVLLFQASSTQRVSATKNEDGSWLLSKEWRHNSNDPWIQGKGITLPKKYVQAIGELLVSGGTGDVIEEHGFEYLEYEGVEKGDFSKKSTNSWRKTYANYRKENPLGRGVQSVY